MGVEPESDLGALIYAVRPLPRPLPIVLALGFVLLIDVFIFVTNGHSLVFVAWGTAGALLVIGAAALGGFLELHRLYEHGVVVGLSWPRGRPPYVIPLSSVDPASVTVHHRANMLARRLGTGGSPTMRMAWYSTRAVSFVGRSWELSNAALDPDSPVANPRKRRMLETRQAAFGRGPMPSGDTSLWALGVRDPEPLLQALERAFAADGHPQSGLAERALRHPVVEPSGRPMSIQP
jgi:hypothetical protein